MFADGILKYGLRSGAADQDERGVIGTTSEACFLACFAAFFSLGVFAGCFFVSLLDSFALPMIMLLVIASERRRTFSLIRYPAQIQM